MLFMHYFIPSSNNLYEVQYLISISTDEEMKLLPKMQSCQVVKAKIQTQIFLTGRICPKPLKEFLFQTSSSNPLEGQEISLLDEDLNYRMKISTLMYETTEQKL